MSGTTSRLANGFLKMYVTGGSGADAPANGTSRFAIELPGFGLFAETLLTNEKKIVTSIAAGTCPSQTMYGIFVYALWTGTAGTITDVSLSTTPAYGLFNWNPNTNQVTIADVRNLTSHATLAAYSSISLSGTCSNGVITLSGAGDRGGTIRLGALGGGLYTTLSERFLFVTPQETIEAASKLNGTYSTWIFDESAHTNVLPVSITISSGSSGTGDQLTDIEADTTNSSRTWSITGISINNPFDGAFTGSLSLEGGSSRPIACAAFFSSKNFLFCAAQNPDDATRPLNFVMQSTASSYSGGGLDTYSFGGGTGKVSTTLAGSSTYGRALGLQADGKIMQAGSTYREITVARFNPDGSLDTTYGSAGLAFTTVGAEQIFSLAIDGQSRTVAVGYSPDATTRFSILRFTSGGVLDTTFDSDGYQSISFGNYSDGANAVTTDSSNRVVVIGNRGYSDKNHIAVARLLESGGLDTSFNATGKLLLSHAYHGYNYGEGIAQSSNGKILLGARISDLTVIRLNSNGTVDTTFGTNGYTILSNGGSSYSEGPSLALQNDGKIVAAGGGDFAVSGLNFQICRLTTSGVEDTTFGTNGYKFVTLSATGRDRAYAVALQTDGKIVAAGEVAGGSGDSNWAVLRLTTNGAVDTTFDGDGSYSLDYAGTNNNDEAYSVAIQPDGKIVVGGDVYTPTHHWGIIRLWP